MFRKNRYTGMELITDRKRYKYEVAEYAEFLQNIEMNVSESDTGYYEFYIDLLRKEVKYSSLLEINRGKSHSRYIYPFHKMNRQLLDYVRSSDKVEIDIQENNLISESWNHGRYSRILHHIKNSDFKYDKSNHMAIYYDGLNITCAYNGYHSLGVGAYLGNGKIEAEYYDVKRLFEYVNANEDLSFSYNKQKILERYNNQLPEELKSKLDERFYGTDYKLMLIYELCKRKFLYIKAVESDTEHNNKVKK